MNYKITLLPGDGIGVEIMESAVQVLKTIEKIYDATFEFEEKLFGGASLDKYAIPLTDETIETCCASDAVLLGAVGGYQWESLEHHLKPEAGLLKLRKSLELFTNIRPAKVYQGLLDGSSLKKDVLSGTDFVVFRELTGGIYFGEPRGLDGNSGWNTMKYTKIEIERIARLAFDTAMMRKKQLISVDKANVLECSQYWRQVVQEVARDYPEVTLQNMYVDNAAMQIVRDPKQFDVILTSNMFGDILSDIAGMITGSLGMLPSASLGEKYALYEPVHGSAPDIAGKNKANPIAMVASVAMMLEHSFKMFDAAKNIETAIDKTLENGYRTADIFEKGTILVSTTEMTGKIIDKMDLL
jgi:3-isopropylmalate dehydrogenase